MKILEVGENIEICGLKYIVYDSLYCAAYSGHNDKCFKIIDVNKEEFTTNILGYYIAGAFPYSKSLEDLTKLVNALNEEYNRQQGKNKEFILPEKWCVKARNKEEDDILIKWRNGGHSDAIGESYMLSEKFWSSDKGAYTEITFEQFKQYVLKESIKETKKYDFSTTITRAVRNNDPNIIAIETGKSIEELCKLVEDGDNGCLRHKLDSNRLYDCDGLNCRECPLSELTRNMSKSEIISWLKSNSLEVKTPEFKVGDWVTMIQNYSKLKPGETYKLKSCQNEINNWWYIDHPTICAAPRANRDFRHATKEEIESVTRTNTQQKEWVKCNTQEERVKPQEFDPYSQIIELE